MTQVNTMTAQQIDWAALCKKMILGGGIAFMLMVIFLTLAGDGRPEWPELWRVRPLAVITIAGAMGGMFYQFMIQLSHQGGWRRVVATVFSLLVYIVGLWMGTVLGLVGTMWH